MLKFLKLGGSLITDKANAQTIRPDLIQRTAREIAEALDERADLSLVIGHGSGSFGHTMAKQYGTQNGVRGHDGWRGFARVATVAAKLNQIILESLDEAGVPVFRIQPSASAVSSYGRLESMSVRPIEVALREGLAPLVYGDVSIDEQQGGTIISTEALFAYLAPVLKPHQILLAGDYDGVLDSDGKVIPLITPKSLPEIDQMLGGSAWTDVTGGMAGKVRAMLDLCGQTQGMSVHIFSGHEPGQIRQSLVAEYVDIGTKLSI